MGMREPLVSSCQCVVRRLMKTIVSGKLMRSARMHFDLFGKR